MSPLAGAALAVLVVTAFVLGVTLVGTLLPGRWFGAPVTLVAVLLAGGLLLWHPWRSRLITGALGVVLGVAVYFLLWGLLLWYVPGLGLLNTTVLVAAVMVAPVLVVEQRRRRR